MTGKIRIPVSADLQTGDVEKAVQKLNEQMNRLAATIAAANKVQFNPVGQGSLADLKRIEERFKELTKVSAGLRERIKSTGQSGSSFGNLDWDRLYSDPAMRERKRRQAFDHVTSGSRYGLPPPGMPPSGPPPGGPPPLPPHGGGGGPPSGGGGGGGGGGGPGLGGVLGGAASAGLRAAGPLGGALANAGAAGAAGGIGAGLMGLLGGLAALAVGKGVSAIKGKIDTAGQEGINYDTLKRTLGDVNVSFNLLRSTLRGASDNIDVTFEEAQKLGMDFAKLSGISKEQYKTLADEVSVGGGFGRSFGVDPSESNQFFANQRQFGTTSNLNDSRKLALMIGEAVGKSGTFAKADELLSAIASYTANQARNGLAAPNVAGFSGMLAGLVGSKIPGLDPQGAAALLSRVNGSIAGGGSSGEASQNFLFSVLGKKHGLDPVQAMLLQQQGAFGTGRGAFGSKLYKDFTKKFGGGVSAAAAESDEMNLPRILEGIKNQSNGNRSIMLNSTARTLGISETMAMALHTIDAKDLNGMSGRMGRLGLDLGKMSSTSALAMANIEGGKPDDLKAQADALRRHKKPLSAEDDARLRAAESGGNVEELKDILAELTYSREQESTEGSRTRESIQGVDKRLQELATHLVPAMNTMRDALIVGLGGGKGATGLAISAANINADEEIENIKGSYKARLEEQSRIVETNGLPAHERLKAESRHRTMNMTDQDEIKAEEKRLAADLEAMGARYKTAKSTIEELKAEQQKQIGVIEAKRANDIGVIRATNTTAMASTVGAGATPDILAKLAEVDKELGLRPGTSAGVFQTESRFNPNAVSSAGARGYAQIMPKTQSVLEQRFGRKFNPANADDSVLMFKETMRENMTRFGNQDDALRAYNGGWDQSKWGNPETSGYVPKVEANRASFLNTPKPFTLPWESFSKQKMGIPTTPIPEGLNPMFGSIEPQKVQFEGHFTLTGPNGKPAAEKIVVNNKVSKPSANGAGG